MGALAMVGRSGVVLGYRLGVAILAVSLLAGCSTLGLGGGDSSFGGKAPGAIATISNIGDYTADRALGEARSHFRNNDFGYSAALYKRVVELSPNDPEGYVGLGASYDRLGRFDLSDRVYASLYGLSGGTAQYFNNVGYSYLLRGNLNAALTNFRKAQKLDPGNIVITNNIQLLTNATAKA
jgi:Flp pilus assembly protein TadD